MSAPYQKIYRLKLLVVAGVLVAFGVLLSMLGDWLVARSAPTGLSAVIAGLSDVILVAGAIGIAVDFFTGRDKEAADTERTRSVLRELTPDFTDAVVRGFAASPDDLERVATPELLDDIATNALALRLGDQKFAEEVYLDLRDQAIRAPERWHDVQVDVRISTAGEWSAHGTPLFDIVTRWEFTTIPTTPVRRFVVTSERDDYAELGDDAPATFAWFITPRHGLDASDPKNFELVQFTVDGEPMSIRHSSKRGGQTYAVGLGRDVVAAGKPVRIDYTFRTVTPQSGHRVFFDIDQPARNLSLSVDFSDSDIAHLSVTDLIASKNRTRIEHLPVEVPGRVVHVDLDGWVFPRAGFAFVWTLKSELDDNVA